MASAVDEHLALMARSGLMTHLAELDPPVTAEAMARFRADAARRASNVMALAPGRFALCLGPGARGVDSAVPHRLWPIGAGAPAATGDAAPPPRRILPPSLRTRDSAAPAPAGAAPPDGWEGPATDGAHGGAVAQGWAAPPAPGPRAEGWAERPSAGASADGWAAAPAPQAAPGIGAAQDGPPRAQAPRDGPAPARGNAHPAQERWVAATWAAAPAAAQGSEAPGSGAAPAASTAAVACGTAPPAPPPTAPPPTAPAPPALAPPALAPPALAEDPLSVAALVEGQIALAAGIDRLAETVAESRRQAAAVQDAQSDGIDRVAARLEMLVARIETGLGPALSRLSEETAQAGRETRAALEAGTARRGQEAEALQARLQETDARLSERLEAAGSRVADSVGALETRLSDRLAGFGADLAERMEARAQRAEAEGAARAEAMAQDVRSVALGLSETDARLSEGFATLRLGLRALNDRVAELSAGAASGPPDPPAPAEAPAEVTVLHPAAGEREGESLPQLRATLEALLARLDGEGRRPPADGAAAVWRRSSAPRERPR